MSVKGTKANWKTAKQSTHLCLTHHRFTVCVILRAISCCSFSELFHKTSYQSMCQICLHLLVQTAEEGILNTVQSTCKDLNGNKVVAAHIVGVVQTFSPCNSLKNQLAHRHSKKSWDFMSSCCTEVSQEGCSLAPILNSDERDFCYKHLKGAASQA